MTKKNNESKSTGNNYPYETKYGHTGAAVEDEILNECPFAMLDVGYASALAQADEDLYSVALWLATQRNMLTTTSSNKRVLRSWSSKLARFKHWRKQTKHVLHMMWNDREQSILSQYAVPSKSTTEQKPFPSMRSIPIPAANNLMVFWKQWGDNNNAAGSISEPRLKEMTAQLLRHDGKYSFDCGDFPLWSAGCGNPTSSSVIDPRLNYFIGLGLSRNQNNVAAFGDYLTNTTIDLICDDSDDCEDPNESSTTCAQNATLFPEVYAVRKSSSTLLLLDECGSTSTATAAILYHLLLDDFDFTFQTPIPPIRNSWVITLITLELMIAFAVAVSCVALSLSLVQRENRRTAAEEDDDAPTSGSYMAVENIEDEASVDGLMQDIE
jgi:hypothetical protein